MDTQQQDQGQGQGQEQTKKQPTKRCDICDETFNKSNHAPVLCLHCNQSACRACCTEYMMTCVDPMCMFPDCKKPWTRKFCALSFTKQFMATTYRELRETRLFHHEQSLLPATQILAEQYNRIYKLLTQSILIHTGYQYQLIAQETQIENRIEFNRKSLCLATELHRKRKRQLIRQQYRDMSDTTYIVQTYTDEEQAANKINMEQFRVTMGFLSSRKKGFVYKVYNVGRRIKMLRTRQLILLYRLDAGDTDFLRFGTRAEADDDDDDDDARADVENQEAPAKKARVFVRACPNNDCRGFLSSQWKCGLCDMYTCSQCHVLKGKNPPKKEDEEDKTDTHTCNPDDVATAVLLKKDSKPCPKCAAQIFKISGCDQMWCTVCSTPFSWRTGTLVTNGIVHNPHYFEWMRRTGGAADRNPMEVRCGRELNQQFTVELCLNIRLHADSNSVGVLTKQVMNIINSVIHIQQIHLAPHMHANAAEDNLTYRFDYLTNNISLAQFKKSIQMANKRFEKKREMREVLTTFVQTATDILYDYSDSLNASKLDELDQFILYINAECFAELKTVYGTPSLYNLVLIGSPENALLNDKQRNNVLININTK